MAFPHLRPQDSTQIPSPRCHLEVLLEVSSVWKWPPWKFPVLGCHKLGATNCLRDEQNVFLVKKKMAPRWIASGELCFKTLKKKM